MTMADSPVSPPPAITTSVHGPYEDLAIAAIGLVEKLIDSQTPEVKIKIWSDYLGFMDAMRSFGSRVDVLHLFHATTASSAP